MQTDRLLNYACRGKNEMDNKNNNRTQTHPTDRTKEEKVGVRKLSFVNLFYANRITMIKTSRNRNVELAIECNVTMFGFFVDFKQKIHAIVTKFCVIHVLLM